MFFLKEEIKFHTYFRQRLEQIVCLKTSNNTRYKRNDSKALAQLVNIPTSLGADYRLNMSHWLDERFRIIMFMVV